MTNFADFLGPLALRLYLVPVFWVAGTNKLSGMDNVIAWFGNSDWGLGLPAPALMAYLATGTEVLGAVRIVGRSRHAMVCRSANGHDACCGILRTR